LCFCWFIIAALWLLLLIDSCKLGEIISAAFSGILFIVVFPININIRWENSNSSLFLLTSPSSPFLPKHEFETELLRVRVRMRMNSSLSDEVLQERWDLSKHWLFLWAWVTTHFHVNNSRVRWRAQHCPFHFEQWLPSLQRRDESMLIGKTWTLQDEGVLFALGVFLKHPSKWLKPHLLIVD